MAASSSAVRVKFIEVHPTIGRNEWRNGWLRLPHRCRARSAGHLVGRIRAFAFKKRSAAGRWPVCRRLSVCFSRRAALGSMPAQSGPGGADRTTWPTRGAHAGGCARRRPMNKPDTSTSEDSHITVTDEEALELHSSGRPGKIEITPTKPLTTQRDLSLAYSPGVAAPCLAIQRGPEQGVRLHRQGQPGRGDLERHGGARPRQSRRARRQAGDGRQVGAVQALRRHRRDRPRGRHRGRRRVRRLRAPARADLRRHQPRGHQGARLLHHRAAPARADGHPGVPRRSARHRDHRRRRPDQRARPDRPLAQATPSS